MHQDDQHVQFGCGFCAPEGWLSFDCSPTLRFERIPVLGRLFTKNSRRFPRNVRYGDIVKGLPLSPSRCKGLFASHVLEHLSLADLHRALANCRELLATGGIFRMIVPDIEALSRRYLSALESGNSEAAARFVKDSGLGQREHSGGWWRRLRAALGNSRHRWMWDWSSLSTELRKAHFSAIRRCAYGDCEDQAFLAVEDRGRFDGCLAVECRRPLGR